MSIHDASRTCSLERLPSAEALLILAFLALLFGSGFTIRVNMPLRILLFYGLFPDVSVMRKARPCPLGPYCHLRAQGRIGSSMAELTNVHLLKFE